MPEEIIKITDPLVIMFRTSNDTVQTNIHAPKGYTHEHYGLLVCDLVRHIAQAFNVDEDDVWDWVDKERYTPTSKIEQAN